MLSKRIIGCLDVRNGNLAKSVKFVDTRDIGDPVAKAKQYYNDGLDELFLSGKDPGTTTEYGGIFP